ncbi:MAG TPA: hypothetical protein VF020_21105 [Chthoniobacterales bacterium]
MNHWSLHKPIVWFQERQPREANASYSTSRRINAVIARERRERRERAITNHTLFLPTAS